MSAFTSLGFFDTSTFTATYVMKYRQMMLESNDPLHYAVKTLDLVKDGEEQTVVAYWRAAKALIQRIEAHLATQPRLAKIVNAQVVALGPLARIAWDDTSRDNVEGLLRVHLVLIPCPGAWVYSNGEQAILPVGFATIVNHAGLNSEINADYRHTTHKLVLELQLEPV